MKINSISPYQGINSTNFKAAVPVFIYTVKKGQDIAKATPITNEKMIVGYCKQLTQYLNNSLPINKNPKRDEFIKNLREFFNVWMKDFCNKHGAVDNHSKVKAFTCVDGGRRDNTLFPLFYLTTGETRKKLIDLCDKYQQTVKESGGYITAEMASMDQTYPLQGKDIVSEGFQKLKKMHGEFLALHVYFQDNYTKTGKLKNHKFVKCQFKPTSKKPTITLSKK